MTGVELLRRALDASSAVGWYGGSVVNGRFPSVESGDSTGVGGVLERVPKQIVSTRVECFNTDIHTPHDCAGLLHAYALAN